MARRFPAPWSVIDVPSGYRVKDATGLTLGYFNSWDDAAAGHLKGELTRDEAKLLAESFARLQNLFSPERKSETSSLTDRHDLQCLNLELDSRGGTMWPWVAGIVAMIVGVTLMYGYTRKISSMASAPSSPASSTTTGAAPTTTPKGGATPSPAPH